MATGGEEDVDKYECDGGLHQDSEADLLQHVSIPGMLQVESRLEISPDVHDVIILTASVFLESRSYFAHVAMPLILVKASTTVTNATTTKEDSSDDNNKSPVWSIRNVPWFNDPNKHISALAFDPQTPTLFISTFDGTVWELNVGSIFSSGQNSNEIEPEPVVSTATANTNLSEPSPTPTMTSINKKEPSKEKENQLLRNVCHIPGIPINSLLVYSPKHSSADNAITPSHAKLVLATSSTSKLILLANNSPPVVVTFTSPITSSLLFTSPKTGLTSLLVSLESGQNVTTVLDDIDLPITTPPPPEKPLPSHHAHHHHQQQPHTPPHQHHHKSIFRKAKDNFMSRIHSSSDSDKEKSSKKHHQHHASHHSSPATPPPPLTTGGTGVKFTTIDDVSCRGRLYKIPNSKHFARHANNKLDLFDDEFRQMSTIFASVSIESQQQPAPKTGFAPISEKVFAFYTQDLVIFYVIHSGTLKELTRVHVPFNKNNISPTHHYHHKILSIFPYFSLSSSSRTDHHHHHHTFPIQLFIASSAGLAELTLKCPPLSLCAELLLSESPSSTQLLDVACSALNVHKHDVYILAGDIRSSEGKFSKTIIYYKLAGLSYATITHKFGSRSQIPAMLFFFELVDQERAKIPHSDKIKIAHVALIGRIEQYLRVSHQPFSCASSPSSANSMRQKQTMRSLLKKMIINNPNYSTTIAANLLSRSSLLLWALRCLTVTRKCEPATLSAVYENHKLLADASGTKLFWRLLVPSSSSDWFPLWTSSPSFFEWFSSLVYHHLPHFSHEIISRLLILLTPWRPELSTLVRTHVKGPSFSSSDTIIDFASEEEGMAPVSEIVTLFIAVLIEASRRDTKNLVELKVDHLIALAGPPPGPEDGGDLPLSASPSRIESVVSTLLLSHSRAFTRTLSASATHVLVARNGTQLLAWGENKLGCLGIPESPSSPAYSRPLIDTPTPVYFPPALKILISSIAAGHLHNIALTSEGTLLVWGSNRLGQLGFSPKQTAFANRPVPLMVYSRKYYPKPVRFKCISAGSYHSAAIDTNNTLWTWGWGIHGQLGNNSIESSHIPRPIDVNGEFIVYVSCGHSHTAVLTSTGRVYTFGCNHFGQLGLNSKEHKVKIPRQVMLPHLNNVIFRLVEAGTTATVMVTTKNRLYYAGLNPASLKSIVNSGKPKPSKVPLFTQSISGTPLGKEESASGAPHKYTLGQLFEDPPRDFIEPTSIDTSHMAGDISKASVGTTHFVIMSSLGYCYTWGMGKSGQLVRPDDDSKTLELIDTTQTVDENNVVHQRLIIGCDVAAAADCTFIVEKDSGMVFACGFNSCGQLGKLESEDEASVMTVKTKKRVVRIRQPSNIHFKLRSIPGIPKQTTWPSPPPHHESQIDMSDYPPLTISSPEELLQWCLKQYHGLYNQNHVLHRCVEAGTISSASLVETLAENHEEALRHQLSLHDGSHVEYIDNYIAAETDPNDTKALRLLTLLVSFWSSSASQLPPASSLEDLLDRHRRESPSWTPHINSAIRTTITSSDSSTAKWISTNLTPIFILSAITHNSLLQPHPPPPLLSSSDESPLDDSTNNSNNNKPIAATTPTLQQQPNSSSSTSSSPLAVLLPPSPPPKTTENGGRK